MIDWFRDFGDENWHKKVHRTRQYIGRDGSGNSPVSSIPASEQRTSKSLLFLSSLSSLPASRSQKRRTGGGSQCIFSRSYITCIQSACRSLNRDVYAHFLFFFTFIDSISLILMY